LAGRPGRLAIMISRPARTVLVRRYRIFIAQKPEMIWSVPTWPLRLAVAGSLATANVVRDLGVREVPGRSVMRPAPPAWIWAAPTMSVFLCAHWRNAGEAAAGSRGMDKCPDGPQATTIRRVPVRPSAIWRVPVRPSAIWRVPLRPSAIWRAFLRTLDKCPMRLRTLDKCRVCFRSRTFVRRVSRGHLSGEFFHVDICPASFFTRTFVGEFFSRGHLSGEFFHADICHVCLRATAIGAHPDGPQTNVSLLCEPQTTASYFCGPHRNALFLCKPQRNVTILCEPQTKASFLWGPQIKCPLAQTLSGASGHCPRPSDIVGQCPEAKILSDNVQRPQTLSDNVQKPQTMSKFLYSSSHFRRCTTSAHGLDILGCAQTTNV
jgi:hypothetical protein